MKNQRITITKLFRSKISSQQILSFTRQFKTFVFLNSNSNEQLQNDSYHSYNLILAAESILTIPANEDFFSSLKKSHTENSDWLFGYISYDVKNQVERLTSKNHDGIHAPDYFFFRPRYVFEFREREVAVHFLPGYDDEAGIHKMLDSLTNVSSEFSPPGKLNIQSRINKEQYINNVVELKRHIRRGDIYETNFCMEFYAEDALIDPSSVYNELNSLSPMPFSAYFRSDDIYLMCASPERFLARRKNKIISQPIKGTAKRGANEADDKLLIEALKNDPKEQAENVMIVDLVRNDLSRTATRGSVKVDELFGIKTYRQLHQMVSTVTSEINDAVHFTDVIRNAFPMGSMTGAPKVKAMELIEKYESTKRGIYSGTIGYITPAGDFDFNVVIRSILYNAENRYLSFMAGSAITDACDPEKEYEECLLKAAAMKKVLGAD